MAETFQLDLVTPEKMLLSQSATQVEAPGAEGDFGVLPLHSPLVALLRAGTVTVHAPEGNQRVFITGGLAQVDAERMVILADDVKALTPDQQQAAQQFLQDALQTPDNTARLQIAQAWLEALKAA